jgi:hypothetical protein
MKRARQRQTGKGGFDLIEEATHLLRTAPAATLAAYYLGALPFVLGLLFFWADMSRSPFAPRHLAGASLGMAALFLWLKFWQAIFARRVRAQAAAAESPGLSLRQCGRIFLSQAIIQPSALFVLPLALIPVLPFAWVFAFYQNVSVLAAGEENEVPGLLKKSWRQARLWPRQNHAVLAIMLAFASHVFLNWALVCFTLPQLLKMLFGIESDFTKSPVAMLNTTFFASVCGLTYLCVDPILRTVYALRCFYGESLESGEDLKAELKPWVISSRQLAGALLVLLSLLLASPAAANGTNAPPPVTASVAKSSISPADLDRVIRQTIQEPKYTWRMPRALVVELDSGDNIFSRFFNRMGALLRDWARAFFDWLRELWHKFFPDQPSHSQAEGSGYGWIMLLQVFLYGLVVAAVAALGVFLWRVWLGRHRPGAMTAALPVRPAPDLADENVGADQLPEDGWTTLARELLERGEFRLAMRAFYLASLSHLATRNLISIARFKSNRDYERELRRRAHSFPDLLAVFDDNLAVFERIWYGMHEVNGELVRQFAANLERIKAG